MRTTDGRGVDPGHASQPLPCSCQWRTGNSATSGAAQVSLRLHAAVAARHAAGKQCVGSLMLVLWLPVAPGMTP